jgi:hypothetical protein
VKLEKGAGKAEVELWPPAGSSVQRYLTAWLVSGFGVCIAGSALYCTSLDALDTLDTAGAAIRSTSGSAHKKSATGSD